MKRAFLFLLPLILIGTLLYIAPWNSDEDSDSGLQTNTQVESDKEDAQPASLIESSDGDANGQRQGLETPAVPELDVEPLTLTEADPETEWLEGRVSWPVDHQPQGTVWVYAFPENTRRTILDETIHKEPAAAFGAPLNSSLNSRNRLRVDKNRSPLLRVKMNTDGSFRIPLPAWRPGLHLQVQGRHLYRENSFPVPNPPWGPGIELDCQVGVWVRGRVIATSEALTEPNPAPKDFDGLVLVHEAVDLAANLTPGSRSSRGFYYSPLKPNGTFEILGMPPMNTLQLEANPNGFARARKMVGETKPGQSLNVDIPLNMGRTLSGLVLDPDGNPIVHAEVYVHLDDGPMSQTRRELGKSVSGSDGSFTVANVMEGPLMLQAHHGTWLPSDLVRIPKGEAPESIEVTLRAGHTFRGITQFSDGTPAPNITLKANLDPARLNGMEGLSLMRNLGSAPITVSDAEGKFVMHGLAQLPYMVEAKGEHNGRDVVGRAEEIRPGDQEHIVILGVAEGLSGTVVNAEGEPLKSYVLFARRAFKGVIVTTYDSEVIQRVRNDEGRFTIADLGPGQWELQVNEGLQVLEPPVEVTLPIAPDAEPLVLVTTLAKVVQGVVLDPQGAPFPGAQISVQEGGLSIVQLMGSSPMDAIAMSDEEGKFTLGPLTKATHGIRAKAKDLCPSETIQVSLEGDTNPSRITLQLREGATLTGQVLDDNGAPNTGRMISVSSSDNPGQAETSTTDSQGEFRLEHLVPGAYQVVSLQSPTEMALALEGETPDISALTGGMKTASADLKDGETTHVVLGDLPTDPIRIRGLITLGGEPVGSGFITFNANGKSLLDNVSIVPIEEDGHYDAVLDGGGRYRVTVQRVGASMLEQATSEFIRDIPQVEEHELDFALPEARISGRVVNPEGEPAQNVRLSVFAEGASATNTMMGGSYVETTSDSEGNFNVHGLLAGDYFVSAGGSAPMGFGSGNEAPGRVSSPTLSLKEGEWVQDLVLKLKKPGTIKATVVDETGKPVAGASLFVRDATGRRLEAFSLVSTGANGEAEYSGLAPGEYIVSSRTIQLASEDLAPITVKEGEDTEVVIPLKEGTTLRLIFRDKDGNPSPATVQVFAPSGFDMSRLFGQQDLQALYSKNPYLESERRIGPLAPGAYRIKAVIDGKPVEKSVRLRGQAEKRLTLRAR